MASSRAGFLQARKRKSVKCSEYDKDPEAQAHPPQTFQSKVATRPVNVCGEYTSVTQANQSHLCRGTHVKSATESLENQSAEACLQYKTGTNTVHKQIHSIDDTY